MKGRDKAKICVITGSRADYGLLVEPMRCIANTEDLRLQLCVTGSHLSPDFGETWREIEQDGFVIDRRVDLELSGDAAEEVSAAMGRAVAGFTVAFAELVPTVVVVLGDRYEMLGAAIAAALKGLRIVHLCGGDVTEGAVDDSFRHCITKLAHVHCVTNADAARRVTQLGEMPENVFITGSPGLDQLGRFTASKREQFLAGLELEDDRPLVLVSYHPTTLSGTSPEIEADVVVSALDRLGPEIQVLFTGSNADVGGKRIAARFRAFAESREDVRYVENFGTQRYFDALTHCDVLVGNSSSGYYEAPSFGIPTVNVGDRQTGRIAASSVQSCALDVNEVWDAVQTALVRGRVKAENPYGDGASSPRIRQAIRYALTLTAPVRKRFYNLEVIA